MIESVDINSRINYTSDLNDIFIRENIGHAAWNYKEMSFKLVDKNMNVESQQLVDAVAKKIKIYIISAQLCSKIS